MKMKRKAPVLPQFDILIPSLIAVWRQLHKMPPGPPERLQTREFRSVVDSVKKLISGLELSDALAGQDYFKDRHLLGAYLLYQWILHYAQGLSLIGELPETPHRVLDLCSGPGAFAFAALQHGSQDVFALDQNSDALKLGAEICGKNGYVLTPRTWKGINSKIPVDGSFDLIIVGYALLELFPEKAKGWPQQQTEFINLLISLLNPKGHLLFVESSWPHANKRLLRLRDDCVSKGMPVQAPCVWKGPCPALQAANSPCFAQRPFEKPFLISELQRAAQINLSSLKMSYLVLNHPNAGWPSLPEEKLYRVISPPTESARGKRYYLCGRDGKKALGSRISSHPSTSKAFEYLQRGDLISIDKALETPERFEITQETQLKVVVACGKPIKNLQS